MALRRSSRTAVSKKTSYTEGFDDDSEDEEPEEARRPNLRSSRRAPRQDEEYDLKAGSRYIEYEEELEEEPKLSVSQMRRLQVQATLEQVQSQPVSSFEEFPEVLGELSLDDLKDFCAQNDLKPPRAKAGIVQTILERFGSECLVEFLQRWKVSHLELMNHYWGASNHAAATKLEKALLIESYLANGYINFGDPNRKGVTITDDERQAITTWLNPSFEYMAESEYPYWKLLTADGGSSSLHSGILSQRLHYLDQLWFAYALFLYDTRPEFRKGVLLRLIDKDHTQIKKNLTGLFAEMIVHDVFRPFFHEEPARSQFVSGEDDGGASSFIDLVFKKCKLYIPSNAYRREDKKCRPGGTLAIEVKTGMFSYIKQQIEDGHVLRQAELHRAADLSVVVLSKDFKKTASEALFREKLREVNTEALALLPAKKILDTICVKIVELVRSTPEEIQRQLSLSSSQNLSASTSSSSPSDSPDQGNLRRSSRTKKTATVESAAQELVRSTAGAKKVSRASSVGLSNDSTASAKRTAKRAYKRTKDPMVITRIGDLDQSVEVISAQTVEAAMGSTPLTDEELAAMMQQEELMAAAAFAEQRGEIFSPPDAISLNAAVQNLSISGDVSLGGSSSRILNQVMEILPEQESSSTDAVESYPLEDDQSTALSGKPLAAEESTQVASSEIVPSVGIQVAPVPVAAAPSNDSSEQSAIPAVTNAATPAAPSAEVSKSSTTKEDVANLDVADATNAAAPEQLKPNNSTDTNKAE